MSALSLGIVYGQQLNGPACGCASPGTPKADAGIGQGHSDLPLGIS